MRKIVYYVAASIDGYISGLGEDISGFVSEGDGVEAYQRDLLDFDTVIMGRRTYEFGYQYGLKPGMPAYPHMQHYIFSRTLSFKEKSPQVEVQDWNVAFIQELKAQAGSDIYLCGGGVFAGWLLENELIDQVKLKLNPFIQGNGIKLFEGIAKVYQLDLLDRQLYQHGLQILTLQVKY